MEFSLEQLSRDWIEGISGEDFCAKVQDRCARFGEATGAVVIAKKDPVHFAVEFFAAVAAGQPIVLANPSWGAYERKEFEALIEQGTQPEELGVPPLGGQCRESDRLKAGLQLRTILVPTGGSAGGVKLAIHTWESLEAGCHGVQDFLGGGSIDSCCVLPLYHVSGLMQLLRAYHTGGHIRFDEDEVAGRCLSYVPTQLQRALADSKCIQKITTARAIFVGGAAMPSALVEKARELKLPIISVYGMTETAAMVAAIPAEEFLSNSQAGALPIGDAQIEIDPCGRIRIQSPALFKGYHGRPPVDLSQGYLTDDEGYFDEQGRLHVTGRVDRLIMSGGEKIDPQEVEDAICQMDSVQECLAVGIPDSEWGQRLVAFYVPDFPGVDASALLKRLKVELVGYKIPKQLVSVPNLPLNQQGKIDLKKIENFIH